MKKTSAKKVGISFPPSICATCIVPVCLFFMCAFFFLFIYNFHSVLF